MSSEKQLFQCIGVLTIGVRTSSPLLTKVRCAWRTEPKVKNVFEVILSEDKEEDDTKGKPMLCVSGGPNPERDWRRYRQIWFELQQRNSEPVAADIKVSTSMTSRRSGTARPPKRLKIRRSAQRSMVELLGWK